VLVSLVHSATLLLKTDKSHAALVYRQLLDRNPENSLYFYGLEKALQPGEYYLLCVCEKQTLYVSSADVCNAGIFGVIVLMKLVIT